MSESDGDPLPLAEEAMAQLAASRRAPVPDEVKLRLRARLAAETGALAPPDGARPVAPPVSSPTVTPPTRPLPWRWLALGAMGLFGGGVLVGVLLDRALRPLPAATASAALPGSPTGNGPSVVESSAPAVAVLHAQPPPPAPPIAPTVEVAAPPAPVAPAEPIAGDEGSGPSRRGTRSSSRDTGLTAERAILEIAHAALTRRDTRTALDALERYARQFPHGRLEEERESIYVRALVVAGRAAEARERAARFRRRFPESLLLPAVEAAVAGAMP